MFPMDYQTQLIEMQQEHILSYWEELTEPKKAELTEQIASLNFDTIKILQKVLLARQTPKPREYSSPQTPHPSGKEENIERGRKVLSEGKAGCLIMAGGMGTRLKIDGPKGIFPVTLSKKSLFQLFSERTLAASRLYGHKLQLAIMTSPLNDRETRFFFQTNNYFGLDPEQVDFFIQQDLPFLDQEGNMFLDTKWHIAEGPNGNGECLKEFYRSGIWDKWKERGIEYLNLVLIDNPLADPFDAELIGTHDRFGCDILVKAVNRQDPDEKVGVIVKIGDNIHVLEYSEIDGKDKGRIEEFPLANLSLFSVSLNFIEKIKDLKLPLHKAFKSVPYLNDEGGIVKPPAPNAWKFETFIFDIFPHGLVELAVYPREECFAPLKNNTGSSSPETVLVSLQEYDRLVYEKISGLRAPNRLFELDPAFYYPTDRLLKEWERKPLPEETYISP